MASITKTPTGKWKARVRAHGASVSKTFTTRKAAVTWGKRKERELEEDKSAGYAHSKLNRMTLSKAISDYLNRWDGKDSSKMARLAWWDERLGKMPVLDIHQLHVREKLDEYADGRATFRTPDGVLHEKAQKRGPGSVNRLQASLSGVFAWLFDYYAYPKERNPARFKGRKEPKGCGRFLSRQEVAALLEACRASTWDRLYLLVLMALNSGARRRELMDLRWKHIDWENRTAMLRDTKNEEDRVLTLSDEVMDELQRHRPGAGKVVQLAQASLMGDTLIFCGIRPTVRRAFDGEWHDAQKRAGIPPLRFHDLRHTAASLLGQNGATLHEIANVLGHKSLSTTKRYAHFCTESKRKLTDSVLGNLANGGNGDD